MQGHPIPPFIATLELYVKTTEESKKPLNITSKLQSTSQTTQKFLATSEIYTEKLASLIKHLDTP